MGNDEIKKIRDELDSIDVELVSILERRMALSNKIGDIKRAAGLAIFDPKRELEVKHNAILAIKDEQLERYVYAVFDNILSISRGLQKRETVKTNKVALDSLSGNIAYQGFAGGHGHTVGLQVFGTDSNFISKKHFEDVLIAISSGEAEFGILPVENAFTGILDEVLDMLIMYNIGIVAEVYIEMEHRLLCQKGASFEDIKSVLSIPQALKQCSLFIKAHKLEEIFVSSTSEAAYMVSNGESQSVAAIAGENASKIYNLDILKQNIENESGNKTRFVIVCDAANCSSQGRKKTIRFSIPNEKTSLVRALTILAEGNIDMSMIVSRMYPGRYWELYFYLDMIANWTDPSVQRCFSRFKKHVYDVKILGQYPEGIELVKPTK